MSLVVAAETPTSAMVRAELVLLRQREGLTMNKLSERCPNICKLPITKLELDRLGLGADDLHVAASRVIKCAIEALVKREDFAQILRATLNIAEDSKDLERRRRAVATRLKLSFKQLRKVEEDAYTEFAGILVSCRQSPCGLEQDLSPITFEVRMQVSLQQLRTILNQLSPDERSTLRTTLSQGVITAFSDGRQLIADLQQDGEGDTDELHQLVLAAINRYWPRDQGKYGHLWTPVSPMGEATKVGELSDLKDVSLAEVLYKKDTVPLAVRRVSLNSLWKLSEQIIGLASGNLSHEMPLGITEDVSPPKDQ